MVVDIDSPQMGRAPRTTVILEGLGIPCVPGSKFATRPGSYQHGTRSAYVAGCCCGPCTEAQTVYTRTKRQAELGRPTRPYVKNAKKSPAP